ncbi:MAG TPA: nitroreductase family protein [Fimbriimonadaceae bacterium]|nr:nitroreductase family protein [Fimbriimonadaceae bacterium]
MRRAVRDYTDEPVGEATVSQLIEAATLAPSAINAQPWAFAVVQDRDLLKKLSDRAKPMLLRLDFPVELTQMIANPEFNIFYNAGTLIVICAKPVGEHPDWDCCLAGENLLLAARDMGLGTCVIGFAWSVLDLPETREELGIPADCRIGLPVIVGHPAAFPPGHGRNAPEILSWKLPPA